MSGDRGDPDRGENPVAVEGLRRLREICLALPEVAEEVGPAGPAFRVRGKSFAMFLDDHHGDGRVAAWCKAPAGLQRALVTADPKGYFVPPYVGHRGWVGVRLDGEPGWDAVADLAEDGCRMVAPERLAALLGRG